MVLVTILLIVFWLESHWQQLCIIYGRKGTRIFTGEELDVQVLLNIIVEKIKLQLLCLTVKRSPQTIKVADEWEVVFKTPSLVV